MKKIKVPQSAKELIEKWIADLRANPDLQGPYALLNYDDKYCCLGRLCKIAGAEDEALIGGEYIKTFYREDAYGDETDEVSFDPIKSGIPEIFTEDKEAYWILASMNDNNLKVDKAEEWGIEKKQYSFPEIADFLESRIEYL